MRIWGLLLLAPALGLTAGCFNPPAPTLHEQQRGLVCMLPGLASGAWNMQCPYAGIRNAGVDAAIRIIEWPTGNHAAQLTDLEGNRAHAASIAQELSAYRTQFPHAPIYLVGYSAGGGVAVLVAEAMSDGVRLENVVLVQAALSPEYDLTRALEHIDGRLVCIYSPLDFWILGAGTRTFGTVDRACSSSVGERGFDEPKAVPRVSQRHKLVQIEWSPRMIWSGHFGNHASLFSYGFNKRYVAPWLGAPRRTEPATR